MTPRYRIALPDRTLSPEEARAEGYLLAPTGEVFQYVRGIGASVLRPAARAQLSTHAHDSDGAEVFDGDTVEAVGDPSGASTVSYGDLSRDRPGHGDSTYTAARGFTLASGYGRLPASFRVVPKTHE